MMIMQMIFLILLLTPASAFAADGCEGPGTASSQTQTLGGCFAAGSDPGSRSGCIMEVAANDKDVVLCDLIEIPGMVRDCIDGVAEVTTITPDKCRIMNEKISRDHCMRAAKH